MVESISAEKRVNARPTMLRVESQFCSPDKTIIDVINKLYDEQKMTVAAVAQEISVGEETLRRWMRELGISRRSKTEALSLAWDEDRRTVFSHQMIKEQDDPESHRSLMRRWQDPEEREKLQTALKEAWAEPQKTKRLSQVHDSEARALRSQSMKDRYKAHPEEKLNMANRLREINNQARLVRMVACLGEDPKTLLEEMVAQGLSLEEIAKGVNAEKYDVRRWLDNFGLAENKYVSSGSSLEIEIAEARQQVFQQAKEQDLLKYLRPNYRQILEALYSEDRKKTSLDKVGKEFGLSRERIRQIEAKSMTLIEMMLSGELVPENGVAKLPRKSKTVKII